MQHIHRLSDANIEKSSIIAIGVFDGVHRGHQALVRRLVKEAHAKGYLAVILTFFPHPDIVLGRATGRFYLSTPEQRAELLSQLSVDLTITHPFDESVREIHAVDFVQQLVHHLHMKALWVGEDFALGYRREGNVPFLQQLGENHNFTVNVIDFVHPEDMSERVSSSQVREFLVDGNVLRAKEWLGRAYFVDGEVIHGDKRGRTIGFPTANLAIWSEQLLPRLGVYAGWATVGGETYMAVTNVGIRPTFEGDSLRVEAHLLDFDREIYGEQVKLTFETFLRPEQKFDGIQQLKAQLKEDIQQGRAFLLANSVT